MNVLSLFDGISCGRVALERAGVDIDNYFASEIDSSAIKVSKYNYNDVVHLGDIRDYKSWNLPNIDLIIGGSPCQDFSSASWTGDGLRGQRSSLFYTYKDALDYFNPKYFLLENVKMKKVYLEEISASLEVDPVLINSSLVSAQNRNRLYWCNWKFSDIIDRKIIMSDIIEGDYYSTRDKSYCIDFNYGKGTNFRRYFFMGSRQLLLENGYYPQGMTKETANTIMHQDGNRWRKLSPLECERLQTLPDDYSICLSNSKRYEVIGNGWTVDVLSHIFKELVND